jgi:hypothetical protein
VSIDDGTVIKIFNCTAYDKVESNSLRAFLKYEQNEPASQDLIDIITESEEGIMNAEVVLAALSDDRWRWIEQGRIDGDRRDIADGLRRSKEEGIRIGEKRGKKEGIAVGKEQGMNEAKIASARNMLARKYPVNDIADITELSVKKIEELAKDVSLQEV